MSFWNPSTQKDAPHEGPHHLLWAPPRRLRHTPSPAGAGPEGLPRIVPPAWLPSRGWPHGSPGHPQTLPLPSSLSWRLVSIQPHCPVLGLSSPCPPPACALRPPLPPSPQPHLSLPASSPSQSSPSLPPSPKALQVLPGVWPPAHVLHPPQYLRIHGLASLFSAPLTPAHLCLYPLEALNLATKSNVLMTYFYITEGLYVLCLKKKKMEERKENVRTVTTR